MNPFITFNNFLKTVFLKCLVPVFYLIFILLLYKTGSLPKFYELSLWQIVLIVLFLFGLAIWLINYRHISPLACLYPKGGKLITSGPYRFVRHPMYLGIMIAAWAASLLVKSTPGFWYATLIIFPINFVRAKWEEKILLEVFGEKYRNYQRRTLF